MFFIIAFFLRSFGQGTQALHFSKPQRNYQHPHLSPPPPKMFSDSELKGTTWNGAISNSQPDPNQLYNGRLKMFFKATRDIDTATLHGFLEAAAKENLEDTVALAFYTRDCRGGKGERKLGRQMLQWLKDKYPEALTKVLKLVPEYGRWDDMQLLRGWSIWAQQLKQDVSDMEAGKKVSLAAKWAPTEGGSSDRHQGGANALRLALGQDISWREYRKTYLAPLREYLKIVERLMCANQWPDINYNHVPSCAMKILKDAFERHDVDRFKVWKDGLKTGATKVNAKALFPHDLVKEALKGLKNDDVTEAQWKVLEDETQKLGIFGKSLVLSDVSGSMETGKTVIPLHVSIALGILISRCCQAPWKDKVITFESNPTFVNLQGRLFNQSFYQRVATLKAAPWGGSTNFQAVFDLILRQAKDNQVHPKDMPERLFVLSDMQFDSAFRDGGNLFTNFEVMDRKYRLAGYVRPQIWFWNIAASTTPDEFPVTTNDQGTVMISGFSANILKSLLTLGQVDPVTALRATLDGERYKAVYAALRS